MICDLGHPQSKILDAHMVAAVRFYVIQQIMDTPLAPSLKKILRAPLTKTLKILHA